MTATLRHYAPDTDYEKVAELLVNRYSTTGKHINWLQPRWEYMHFHPLIWNVDLTCIGVWEAEGKIVGVVHPEHFLGTAYFQMSSGYEHLKEEMLLYAEQHIAAVEDGKRSLSIFINDHDDAFQELARGRGYAGTGWCEPMSHMPLPREFPEPLLPDGFRMKSLADDNNLAQITRVLYRGFDHGDEPEHDYIEERTFMQSAPNYRKDLNIVIEAPNGNFVSYAGLWYEESNCVAYVEPVCTDPEYRRMGLASAALCEGIRRCQELGATVAYVGTDKPVYLSVGFKPIFNRTAWGRELV